ncbi:MAG: nucleotidyltransferase domain-containing protein [Eubacterium sp.]|nr:nucleotidyltransferase domain-containing protein [Eubacterium sp.]
MRDIEKEIRDNLDEIERKYNVKILYAIESGSRAWGFASPDSDYDVRFIYQQKKEEYLRIDPGKDVIEWQLDEVLDINGWDLKKALLAFAKGNPNVMEWANSPIVYRKAEEWDMISEAARYFFSEKASLYHYYGTANSTYHGYLTGEKVKYKKYLYALRPLLCCRWIERFHSIPPMRFEELLVLFDGTDEELDDKLLRAINLLLEKKAVTVEGELNDHIPEVIGFIENELPKQKAVSDNTSDDRKRDYSRLNEVFFDLVMK